MTPAEVLAKARAAGVRLQAADGGLRAGPRARLTPELRQLLAEHKAALIAICETPDQESRPSEPASRGAEPEPLAVRYPFEVRWAREKGWLLVQDCLTGEWHELPARECPRAWLASARSAKAREASPR